MFNIKTHCRAGHTRTERNTYINKGFKKCRICISKRALKYRQKKAELNPHKPRLMNGVCNATNSTGFRGVHTDPHRKTFRARIKINGHITNLGSFKTAEEASKVYEAKLKVLKDEHDARYPGL